MHILALLILIKSPKVSAISKDQIFAGYLSSSLDNFTNLSDFIYSNIVHAENLFLQNTTDFTNLTSFELQLVKDNLSKENITIFDLQTTVSQGLVFHLLGLDNSYGSNLLRQLGV